MQVIVSEVLNCLGKYGQPTRTDIRQATHQTAHAGGDFGRGKRHGKAVER
jgi:hypothetical protein